MGNMRLPVINGNENEIDVEAASKLIEVRPDEDVPAWVFRFLQSFPSVTVTLSGMSDMEQLKANIHTYEENKPLDEAEMQLILGIADEMISSIMRQWSPKQVISLHRWQFHQWLMTNSPSAA